MDLSAPPSPANLQDVLDVLRGAGFSSAYWRPLGRRLRPDLDLDAIESNHQTVERRLEEVVNGWQRDGETSWEKLADAVSQCKDEGGGRNIAQKILERVGLGHYDLPKQGSGDSAIGSEERQSVSSSITLQSPVSLFPNRQLREMLSGKEVKDAVSDLNTQFNEMVSDTQDALDESKAAPKKIINILRLSDEQFSYTPQEVFDSLRMAADVLDLFAELGEYWDHFNYHLLERLILRRPTERLFAKSLKRVYHNLRERMKQYNEDIDYFRRHTAVEVYCKAVRQPKPKKIPADFKELIKECESEKLKTLHDVEEFRQEVAFEYKLSECLVFCKYLETGSVIVTLWIPKSAEPIGRLLTVFRDTDGSSVDPSPVTYEDEIKEPTSDDETLISAQSSNEDGSSVDPIPLRDETEVGEPDVLHLPSQSEAPEEMQVIAKRESMVASVLTTVSKLVLPKYVIDPIVLMRAVSLGDKAEVENLISRGANPNVSPPMIEFTPLMEASRLGNVEIAQLLLEKGARPNLTNKERWTALMAAANNGCLGTTDVLLRNRANPDMQDDTGWSALMAAVYKRHDDVALRMIEAGATPHIQDQNHTNALLLATATNEQGTVVDALLDHVQEPAELDTQDSYGETTLIFACKNGNLQLVERLLSMGANPDIGNNYKETPVLIATQLGMKEILKELLEKGANPNKGARPPLHVATASDMPDIIRLLLSHGADPTKQDEQGVMAFEIAEMRNLADLAKRLNPQQFSLRTTREIFKLTIKSLASVKSHISLGPLFLNPETKSGWLQSILQKIQVR